MTEFQIERIVGMRKNGHSFSKIADTLGLSRNTIKSFCQRKQLADNLADAASCACHNTCEMCGKAFIQTVGRKKRRFCSDACRMAWWNTHRELIRGNIMAKCACLHCGKHFAGYEKQRRKFCSHHCYIAHRYGTERKCHV